MHRAQIAASNQSEACFGPKDRLCCPVPNSASENITMGSIRPIEIAPGKHQSSGVRWTASSHSKLPRSSRSAPNRDAESLTQTFPGNTAVVAGKTYVDLFTPENRDLAIAC